MIFFSYVRILISDEYSSRFPLQNLESLHENKKSPTRKYPRRKVKLRVSVKIFCSHCVLSFVHWTSYKTRLISRHSMIRFSTSSLTFFRQRKYLSLQQLRPDRASNRWYDDIRNMVAGRNARSLAVIGSPRGFGSCKIEAGFLLLVVYVITVAHFSSLKNDTHLYVAVSREPTDRHLASKFLIIFEIKGWSLDRLQKWN